MEGQAGAGGWRSAPDHTYRIGEKMRVMDSRYFL